MLWLLSLVLAGPVSHMSAAVPISKPSLVSSTNRVSALALLALETRRIRSQEPRLTKLVTEGARRSSTFADLVVRLHRTDVIVYVESTHDLPSETVGRIVFQAIAGNQRYLRIQVRTGMQGDQVIAVVGHELRHALEVADDAAVVDEAGLALLYRRIGHSSLGPNGFDTDAARGTGIRVRDELIG